MSKYVPETFIAELDLGLRAERACKNLGIKTLRELSQKTRNELSEQENIGNMAVAQLEAYLFAAGLNFKALPPKNGASRGRSGVGL